MAEIIGASTGAEFETALTRIIDLINCAPGSTDEAELIRISEMVIEYEDEHYPMGEPDPHSMLEFMLDQQMVSREQLIPLAGGGDALEMALVVRQPITPALAALMHERFGLPVEVLVKSPSLASSAASG